MTESSIGTTVSRKGHLSWTPETVFAAQVSLRKALLVDAAISGTTSAALLVGAGPLGDLLDLSPSFLRWVGAGLVPFVAFIGYTATRNVPAFGLVKAVIGMNLAWTIASLLLLVSGWIDPSPVGYVFVVGQALMVGLFAEIQFSRLRRLSGNEQA